MAKQTVVCRHGTSPPSSMARARCSCSIERKEEVNYHFSRWISYLACKCDNSMASFFDKYLTPISVGFPPVEVLATAGFALSIADERKDRAGMTSDTSQILPSSNQTIYSSDAKDAFRCNHTIAPAWRSLRGGAQREKGNMHEYPFSCVWNRGDWPTRWSQEPL